MRTLAALLFLAGLFAVASVGDAQPPGGGKGKKDKKDKGGPGFGFGGGRASTVEEMVAKLMAYDKNGDGKLTKEELTDSRLHVLFDRADANKNGAVTKEQLTALISKEAESLNSSPGFGPPGGPGGPGFGPPGGPGFFGPPPVGQVMPPFILDQLNLTDEQKKQFDALQKEVDAKVEKLLTDEQRKMLKEMKERRPPGFGPGGPGGFPPPKKN